jgi:hypothetical protein
MCPCRGWKNWFLLWAAARAWFQLSPQFLCHFTHTSAEARIRTSSTSSTCRSARPVGPTLMYESVLLRGRGHMQTFVRGVGCGKWGRRSVAGRPDMRGALGVSSGDHPRQGRPPVVPLPHPAGVGTEGLLGRQDLHPSTLRRAALPDLSRFSDLWLRVAPATILRSTFTSVFVKN